MRTGQARKRDANEASIVNALRAVGATVERLSGKDIPDLLVGYLGCNYLLEVKMPGGKLSIGQQTWMAFWRGPCEMVRTVDDALAAIGCKARRTA